MAAIRSKSRPPRLGRVAPGAALFAALLASTPPVVAGQTALYALTAPRPGDVSRLSAAGFTVVRLDDRYLLAFGPDAADAPASPQIVRLDGPVGDKVYFTAPEPPPAGHSDAFVVAHDPRSFGYLVAARDAAAGRRVTARLHHATRIYARPVRPPEAIAPSSPRTSHLRAHGNRSPGADPSIAAIVTIVSRDSIDATVQRLQDFKTRWALHDSCQAAAEYIFSRFDAALPDTTYFHAFHTLYKDNVVAERRGITYPNRIVIVCGHYDTVSNNPDLSPGADDNASGAALVVECARVLAPYGFDYTVRFLAFGAEEQGLLGSESYVHDAIAAGDSLVAVINADMIGYLAPGDALDLDVVSNAASAWLRDAAFTAAIDYVPSFTVVDGSLPPGSGSDHVSFWDQGVSAIALFEDTGSYSPYIHTTSDVVGTSYNTPALTEGATRLAVAVLCQVAGVYAAVTAVHPPAASPSVVRIGPNVPNPFTPGTRIPFFVDPPGDVVDISVYDVGGRRVRSLVSSQRVSGEGETRWDGLTDAGRVASSGVYYCRLRTSTGRTATRRMVLVR